MDFAQPNVVKTGYNSYAVEHGNDSNLFVEFEKQPVKNNFKSEAEGRPVFDEVEFITIHFAGDKTKKVHRKVTEEDKKRFKPQYQSFVENGKVSQVGFPIEEWAAITRSEAAEMKAIGIHTVESLAAMPETGLSWLGARSLKQKAENWLKSASGDNATVLKLTSELEEMKKNYKVLESNYADLASKISKKSQKDE